jgi:uncharacterized protein
VPGIGRDVVTAPGNPTVAVTSDRPAPLFATALNASLDNGPEWPDRDGNDLRSAIYEGEVSHVRFGPGPRHSFSQRVAMPLLDLAEVDTVMGMHPAWSSRRRSPVRFRREDFLGDSATPLATAVRDLVNDRTGRRPDGPVAMLANLRTWGWLFNPISLYFCTDSVTPVGSAGVISHLVTEVENTPWHDRHAYVVGPPGGHRFNKSLHVSPFLPADVDYRLCYTAPGAQLTVTLEVVQADRRLFAAALSLRRRPVSRASLGHLLWSHPAMTHRITAGIYAQAARLRLKGAPFFAHPGDRSGGVDSDTDNQAGAPHRERTA